jgi:hypothetical protein
MGQLAGRLVTVAALVILASAARGQPPAPSAEALALARTLVTDTHVGGAATMNGIEFPARSIATDVGAADRLQTKTVMSEAFFPTMFNHSDDLTEIAVKSYAAVLSIDDMKAAIAFFDSPAGKDLLRLRERILRTNATKTFLLLGKVNGELKDSIAATVKAHGWASK